MKWILYEFSLFYFSFLCLSLYSLFSLHSFLNSYSFIFVISSLRVLLYSLLDLTFIFLTLAITTHYNLVSEPYFPVHNLVKYKLINSFKSQSIHEIYEKCKEGLCEWCEENLGENGSSKLECKEIGHEYFLFIFSEGRDNVACHGDPIIQPLTP